MKKVFFALILGIVFVKPLRADVLAEYQKECLSFIDRPETEVSSSYGKLRYKYDKDAAYLKRETEKKFSFQGMKMPETFVPIGLTKVRDVFDFNLVIGQIGISKGYTCVYPTEIKARLEYYMPTIYILNTLREGTCLYDLSLRHEKTHMQIYIEALDYFLPILKKRIDKLFDEVGVKVVARGESAETAAKALNEAYLEPVKKIIDSWRKEVETEQMKLDTPEHYMIENMLCQKIDGELDY